MAQTHSTFQNIARAVSAYADQAYTDAVRLAGTALVGSDARINVNAEDYYGTIRWDKTLGDLQYDGSSDTTGAATVINTGANAESSNEGSVTGMSTDFAEYIKSIRSHGADQYNVTQLITQRDGAIGKVGRDFGTTRARDADAALVSVLKGVIGSEAAFGTDSAGQTNPDSLTEDAGFFYDVGASKLVDTSSAGGKAADEIFKASAFAYSDLEPDFMYLVIQPSVYLDMKSANLLDEQDRITDGNVTFDTILQGKYRLIVSRTALGDYSASSSAIEGTKTSLLMLPGAISLVDIPAVNPVAFDNDESMAGGFGTREVWYRWGYVMHPRGYTWSGAKTSWATNDTMDNASSWTRKENVGNLGILPIFHS